MGSRLPARRAGSDSPYRSFHVRISLLAPAGRHPAPPRQGAHHRGRPRRRRCARSASRCSRRTSTSRSSRTSSRTSASAPSAPTCSAGLNPGQQIVKIVHDELVARARRGAPPAPARREAVGPDDGRPPGLGKDDDRRQAGGSSAQGWESPLLVAADVYRPAAVDQLVQLGDQIGVEVHTRPVGTPALEIARSGLEVGARPAGSTS